MRLRKTRTHHQGDPRSAMRVLGADRRLRAQISTPDYALEVTSRDGTKTVRIKWDGTIEASP